MSLMPSLCAALERAGGERLVMKAGERPHVLAGDRRHDVASAVLSVNAVEALADQILSSAGRQELTTNGAVSELVHSPSFPHPLTAKAERLGDGFCVELIVTMPMVAAQPAEPEPQAEATTIEDTPVEPPLPEAVIPEAGPEYPAEPAAPIPEVFVETGNRELPEPMQRPEVTVVTRVQAVPQAPDISGAPQDLFAWIGHASDLGATTLYLRAGSPAAARIEERIQPIGQDVVNAAAIEEAAGAFTRGGDGLWQPRPDGEWVCEDDEIGYVSCRVFSDQQGTGLIVQLRPQTSLRLLHKHIPRQVRIACEGSGLVVVAASNEADVEALAAAVADWSGRDRGGYLISLQRRSRSYGEMSGAFVSQRTVGGNEKDFAAAIRRAAQEGPDILLITGLQAEQSLQAAVLAAAGGRLVILGVVAPTTAEALRMLAGNDAHVRRAMAASFRAAIGYRSLRRIGGGRTLIQDVVLATSSVCGLLEAGDFDRLARTQQEGAPGIRSVDESLARAVRRRQTSLREAAAHAVDRSRMVALVRALGRTGSSARTAPANRTAHISMGLHDDLSRDGIRAAANMIGGGFSRA